MTKTTPAKRALEATKKIVADSDSWIEAYNKLFGIGGEIGSLFPTESDRTEFTKTTECAEVYRLFDTLQAAKPGDKELAEKLSRANGALSVRIPRSLHAALLLEADDECVSLNQLCLSKLMAQLRSVV